MSEPELNLLHMIYGKENVRIANKADRIYICKTGEKEIIYKGTREIGETIREIVAGHRFIGFVSGRTQKDSKLNIINTSDCSIIGQWDNIWVVHNVSACMDNLYVYQLTLIDSLERLIIVIKNDATKASVLLQIKGGRIQNEYNSIHTDGELVIYENNVAYKVNYVIDKKGHIRKSIEYKTLYER